MTDDEKYKYAWLRATEWGIWPAFLSGPVVPLLLPFVTLWQVVLVVAVLTVLWSFVRYRYVSLGLAKFGVYIAFLRWLVGPSMAVYFITQHSYGYALLSLLWPALSGLFALVAPAKTGVLQSIFLEKMEQGKP